MILEKTDYYNSNAPRANGVSYAQLQQEIIWNDELLARQKADQVAANFGNMECAINS